MLGVRIGGMTTFILPVTRFSVIMRFTMGGWVSYKIFCDHNSVYDGWMGKIFCDNAVYDGWMGKLQDLLRS
jgi:hypothetical protein